jgi:hypothetical protein
LAHGPRQQTGVEGGGVGQRQLVVHLWWVMGFGERSSEMRRPDCPRIKKPP